MLPIIPKLSITSWLLITCLMATIVLGWLLKGVYDDKRASEEHVQELTTQLQEQQRELKLIQQSSLKSEEILNKNASAKNEIDHVFDRIMVKLNKSIGDKKEKPSEQVDGNAILDVATNRVLLEAECTAGVRSSCTTSNTIN